MPLQFNTAYYLEQNPDVAAALDSGAIPSARWHFDNFGAAEGRDPNANFDVSYYLAQNPDVAAAFENGVINPFDHFLRFGAAENRAPSANLAPIAAGFDEQAYLDANPDVAAAVQSGVFADGYQHWVIYGRYEDSRPEATFNGGTPVSDVADTIDATELTAALDALNVANGNVTSYLEDARDNQFLQDDQGITATSTTAEVRTAIVNEATQSLSAETISDASTDTDVSLTAYLGDTNFASRSVTVQNAIIADNRADAQQSITTYQSDIAKVSGLSSAITSYNSAVTKAAAADDALAASVAETEGAVTTFNARANTFANVDALGSDGNTEVNLSSENITTVASVVGNDGQGGDNTTLLTLTNGKFQIAEGQTNVAGITQLRDALQSQYDAQQADTSATTAVTTATTKLNDIYDNATISASSSIAGETDGVAVATELADRQEELSDFNDAVARFENSRDLNTGLTNVDDAAQTAENNLTDSEANGGLGVNLVTDYAAAGTGNDVYLFNEDNGNGTIADFGTSGLDRIYFGEGYTFTQIQDGSQITNNVGNVSELEIFWQQGNDGLNLYVEDQAFAGNSSGVSDITEITLTGVTADEVNFANGYLSAGQMA